MVGLMVFSPKRPCGTMVHIHCSSAAHLPHEFVPSGHKGSFRWSIIGIHHQPHHSLKLGEISSRNELTHQAGIAMICDSSEQQTETVVCFI
jgi:hypothetical protein